MLVNSQNFFRLPFEENSFKLTFNTLNDHKHPDFVVKKRQRISNRKISFANEILTVGITIGDDDEREVYLKVTLEGLLVSDNEDTTDKFLGYFAYMALNNLMSIYDYQDYSKYYWPDFFDAETGNSKYLEIINDRQGLDIFLKPGFDNFYKPSDELFIPELTPKINRPQMIFMNKKSVDDLNNNGFGFCIVDCLLKSWQAVHFPFLLTYEGVLTNDRRKMKSFLGFIITEDHDERYSPMQKSILKISVELAKLAEIEPDTISGPKYLLKLFDTRVFNRFKKMFWLWQDIYPLLVNQPHTHRLETAGLRRIRKKPRKNYMLECKFLYDVPQIVFRWEEKDGYFELSYFFKVNEILLKPNEENTAFFINSNDNPLQFYLFERVSDALLTIFFAERKFKIQVLKAHFQQFSNYWNWLRSHYDFEYIK
ncbi:MAG: hypothetical protein REI78_02710 [Pedobacter sp.]|nr:hypothetical protein [Pedobacter sp.]